jgi:hypothetical protein
MYDFFLQIIGIHVMVFADRLSRHGGARRLSDLVRLIAVAEK